MIKQSEVNSLCFIWILRKEIDIMVNNRGEMMEIHIRRAIKDDIPGIAKVHADSWKTTYKGIFPNEILENITYEQRKNNGKIFFKKNVIINLDL